MEKTPMEQEPSQNQIQMKSEQTKQINGFIAIHENGELSQSVVQDWLDKLPEDKRKDAKYELECGIGTNFEDLPQ
jgi:hypothetical protein